MREYEVKEYFLEIDFSCYETKNVVKKLIYNENDINTAFINIQLKNDGKIINLTDYEVIANIWKNIGNKVQNPCKILNGELGEIEVPLTRQSLKGAGVNPFTISIVNGERSLESPRFYYRVEEAIVSDDDIENADEFGVLVLLISQVKEVLKDNDILVTRVENLENLIEEQEEIRSTQETTRETNELTRETNEKERKINELTRQTNETTRESNEEERKTSEIARKENEDIRSTQETTREENESIRQSNEEERKTNELTRQTNETTRESNEEERKTSEIARQTNETTRESNEEERKTSEIARKENELIRQESISNMQKKIDDKVDEVDNKIVEVNTAKTDMTTTVSNKITEFEKRFNELENLDTAGEILQSKETTDGQIKDTLKERLTYDFNKLDLKIEQLIAGGINVAFNKTYDTSEWIEVDGGFELSVEHKLVTQKILVSSIDKLNRKSLITSYKIMDDNNIILFNEVAIDIEVTVVNGGSAIELIKFTINDDIESLESSYSSIETKRLLDKKANLEHTHDIYVEKVEGKELSTEDYTTEEKVKLSQLDTYKNKETKFNTNGSIIEILDNNIKYITKFNTNGSISKEKYINDILINTTITNFKNGMIEETVTNEGVI
ncbi:BppU family phage baseplate upper protein [Clostridioides difficile]